MKKVSPCPICGGTGFNIKWQKCSRCNGKGWLALNKSKQELTK